MVTAVEELLAGTPDRVAWYDLTVGRRGHVKGAAFVMKSDESNVAHQVALKLFGDTDQLALRHIDPPFFDHGQARDFANIMKADSDPRVLVNWGPSGAGKDRRLRRYGARARSRCGGVLHTDRQHSCC
jgi:hypothetical protein